MLHHLGVRSKKQDSCHSRTGTHQDRFLLLCSLSSRCSAQNLGRVKNLGRDMSLCCFTRSHGPLPNLPPLPEGQISEGGLFQPKGSLRASNQVGEGCAGSAVFQILLSASVTEGYYSTRILLVSWSLFGNVSMLLWCVLYIYICIHIYIYMYAYLFISLFIWRCIYIYSV